MRRKKLSKPKAHKQSGENKINNIRNPLMLKKEKLKENKNRIIKDGIITDVRILLKKKQKKKGIRERKIN